MFEYITQFSVGAHDAVIALLAFVIGACGGSFLNVLAYRYPIMVMRAVDNAAAEVLAQPKPHVDCFDLIRPVGHCTHCCGRLPVLSMLPVISYLFLGGRCQQCKEKIGFHVFAVELLGGIFFAVIIWQLGVSLAAVAMLSFVFGGAALALLDAAFGELPDPINYVMIAGGLLFNLAGVFVPYGDALVALILLYLTGWALSYLVRWLWSWLLGRELTEPMGYGDFKMMAMLGAWFGFYAFHILAAACSLSLVYVVTNRAWRGEVAFQPTVRLGPFFYMAGLGMLVMHLFGLFA